MSRDRKCALRLTRNSSRVTKYSIFNGAQSGFTLLEIMIALAITGISAAIILHTVNHHADLMYENTITTQMYQLAKDRMYELELSMKKSKGTDASTGFDFENRLTRVKILGVFALETTISGHGRKVVLNKLVRKNISGGSPDTE